MKGDALYWFTSHMLDAFIWGGELVEDENLFVESPAVYVSNHALALGPIAIVASLPVRLYPWVIGDMLDWEKAAAYLNRDFVVAQLHIPSPFSMPLARLISQASVRTLARRRRNPCMAWRGSVGNLSSECG